MIDLSPTLCLVVEVACLFAGLWVPRRGRYRVGRTPHCRRCEYILASPSDQCPECGSALSPGGVVYGEPRRSLAWRAVTVVLLLVTAVPLAVTVRRIDWYRLRPTGLLFKDLGSTDAVAGQRAWDELMARMSGGRLNPADISRLDDACLAELTTSSPSAASSAMLDLVCLRAADHSLSAAQEAKFYQGILDVHLKLPARAPAGTPVQCELVSTARGGPRTNQFGGGWQAIVPKNQPLLDGQPLPSDVVLGGLRRMPCATSWSQPTTLPPMSAGHHVLTLDLPVTLFCQGVFESDKAAEQHPRRATLTLHLVAPVDVVADGGPTTLAEHGVD